MSVSESYGGEEAEGSARERASRLPEELRALGRSLDAPGAGGSESMVERVLEQILAERLPVPVAQAPGPDERLRAVRRWARMRWRSLAATLCGLLAVLALTPPVRAAVLDWFDFGGVEVRYDPSAVPSPGAEVPGCGRSVSLAQAERRAGFEPLVPSALGAPDVVTVTAEPRGRSLVSLCWRERGTPYGWTSIRPVWTSASPRVCGSSRSGSRWTGTPPSSVGPMTRLCGFRDPTC